MSRDRAFKTPAELDAMPADAYAAEVRAAIVRGVADVRAGRVHTTEDVLSALAEQRRERSRRVG